MDKLRIVKPKPITNAEKRRWLDDIIKKLENAPSCVDTDGMWTYDRVPSAVVTDTLDLLYDLKDYLMRDKAVEEWCSTYSLSEGWEPVIVRCKDCKHCEYLQSEKDWCKKGHLHGKAENWFCADGERR